MTRQGMLTHFLRSAAAIVIVSGSATAALAADPVSAASKPPAAAAPSKEMRESMAVLHEQMAACLRSDKTIEQCRSEMSKTCHEKLGEHDCPMMSRMHDHMKRPPHTPSEK